MPQPDTVKGFQSFYQNPDAAQSYDRDRSRTVKQLIVRARELDLFLPQIRKGAKILEIGCGTGAITARLPEKAEIVAIDSSEAMLQEAKARLAGRRNVRLEHADLFALGDQPFIAAQRGSFDVIISSRVFLHLGPETLPQALAATIPFLKPDGVLIFDLQRPNFFKRCLDMFEQTKVKNFRYTAAQIEETASQFPELMLEERIPFEHIIFLLPAALLPASWAPKRLIDLALSVDRALEAIQLSANRWMVICRRK